MCKGKKLCSLHYTLGETKSVLLPLQDITLIALSIINRHQDLVSASLEHVYYFSVKIDDIMIKSLIRIMIRESKKWIRQGIH